RRAPRSRKGETSLLAPRDGGVTVDLPALIALARLRGSRVALVGLVLSACALGQPRIDLANGGTGTIAFRTLTPTTGDFARRNLDAPATVIWGELSIPRRASGRVPAVVNNMPGWRAKLNGWEWRRSSSIASAGVGSRKRPPTNRGWLPRP